MTKGESIELKSRISDFSSFKQVVGKGIKRIVDILAGIVGCLLLIPLYFYVRHKNHQQGDYDPIFFKQARIGKDGKSFEMIKFRSRIPNAEAVLEQLMTTDPKIREEYTIHKKLRHDPRITQAGEFLRKTSLDEFPQLINVLKGEMTLIGPRPYLPREKEDMGDYYNQIIQVKPGLGGLWQVRGRSDLSFEDRCELDKEYVENWHLMWDFKILLKTLQIVLLRKGAM
ncbi:sugar transferase [Holdemania massiliensis]|uniref:sugar transferase n=1 Tax=Holdemania massiliensis TaxID=1468449 RepID=UPI00242AE45A|nr:sugar transferase [Holdemania massiliensis]